jgi:3-oxoacyl-[acyl-carrier-protein] synthase-3
MTPSEELFKLIANKRIIEEVVMRINLPNDVAFFNIEKYGNTSTVTLPICLLELEPKLQHGDTAILSSFGAGFSWGALYLKWAGIKADNSKPQ